MKLTSFLGRFWAIALPGGPVCDMAPKKRGTIGPGQVARSEKKIRKDRNRRQQYRYLFDEFDDICLGAPKFGVVLQQKQGADHIECYLD